MFGAMIINENVTIDELTGYFVLAGYNSFLTDEGTTYQVISIDGLDPPKAQLNFTKAATIDGAFFNSATLPTRNIVIKLKINNDVERVRADIKNICRIKEKVWFLYKTDSKEVKIECYVESVEYNLFERSEIVQISLICPSPNFKSTEEIEFKRNNVSTDIFQITNDSECDVGFKLDVKFNNAVLALGIGINSRYRVKFEGYTINTGDILTINAYDGYYNCTLTKAADSETINFLPYLTEDSSLAKLVSGTNHVVVTLLPVGDSATVDLTFTYNTEYRGL